MLQDERIYRFRIWALTVLCMGGVAQAQMQRVPAAGGAMSTYSLPDGTGSVSLPSGWKVTKGGQSLIELAGTHGELVFLGNTAIARNFNSQGQRSPGDLDLPYQLSLPDKLVRIMTRGHNTAKVTIENWSSIPNVPPAFGQCGKFLGSITGDGSGPAKFEATFCSMPLDRAGFYKNIFKFAQMPANMMSQEHATVETVMSSYKLPQAMLQRILAPYTAAAPPMQAGNGMAGIRRPSSAGMNSATINGMAAMDQSVNNFDHQVLRGETPIYVVE